MMKAGRRVLFHFTLLTLLALIALAPATALAQEFEKVTGPLRQEIPAVPFVAAAYGIIWLAILFYVFIVARGLARVDGEIADLKRKVDSFDRQDPRR
jgi:CcmD family protein